MHQFKDSSLLSLPEDCSLPTITSVLPAIYSLLPMLWQPEQLERGQHSKPNGSSLRRTAFGVLPAAASRRFTHRRSRALCTSHARTILAATLVFNSLCRQAVISNAMESTRALLLIAAVCFLSQGEWSLICLFFIGEARGSKGWTGDGFGANYF